VLGEVQVGYYANWYYPFRSLVLEKVECERVKCYACSWYLCRVSVLEQGSYVEDRNHREIQNYPQLEQVMMEDRKNDCPVERSFETDLVSQTSYHPCSMTHLDQTDHPEYQNPQAVNHQVPSTHHRPAMIDHPCHSEKIDHPSLPETVNSQDHPKKVSCLNLPSPPNAVILYRRTPPFVCVDFDCVLKVEDQTNNSRG
jgi:hypothetical protein